MTSSTRRASRNRISTRSFLLLVLLGIVVALVLLRIVFAVEDNWGHDAFIRWGGLVGFTLGIFGLFIGDSEKVLRKRRFWELLAILLVGHLTVFAIVLTHVEEWKLTWFMVMIIEYPLFLIVRNKFVQVSPK